MNGYLQNIPDECSQLHKYLPIAQCIWNSLMQKVFENSTDEDDNPNFAMRVEVDLVQDKKSTHSIVKEILYAKAKEQYLAGHGFGFGFYSKTDSNFETMICFYETQITTIKYVEIVC
jgi:superfamily I DNA and RNA helicase